MTGHFARTGWLALAVLFVAVAALRPASAHPLAPSLLELRERDNARIDVLWKTPRVRATGADLAPRLEGRSGSCRPIATQPANLDAASATARWSVDCGESGAAGVRVGVDGLARSRTDAIVRVEFADGRRFAAVLTGSAPERVIPARSSRWNVAVEYAGLGVRHILFGIDHLLFVLGLLLLVNGRRSLVATISAFTAGHSVTLGLAALGYVRYPSGWIEVAIAASLVVLALELSSAKRTRLGRQPWRLGLGFGLLHGFGFAGALQQVGLPADAIPLSLAAFNLGIEIGQLAFVAGVYAAVAVARPLIRRVPRSGALVPRLASYAIGSLAVYWFFDRTAALM